MKGSFVAPNVMKGSFVARAGREPGPPVLSADPEICPTGEEPPTPTAT